jgi:hypothetical protein
MEIRYSAATFRVKGPTPPIDWLVLLQILGSNCAAIATARYEHWSMLMLIVPFWFQSVAIGCFTWLRMLQLDRFSTEGIQIDKQPVDESPETRDQIANFFVFHFGGFHLGYAIFIVMMAKDGKFPGTLWEEPVDLLATMGLIVLFVFTQYAEFKRDVANDSTRKPNIGAIDWLPYARILPMHLVIVGGAMFSSGDDAILIFGALKTAADLVMHVFSRRIGVGTE